MSLLFVSQQHTAFITDTKALFTGEPQDNIKTEIDDEKTL